MKKKIAVFVVAAALAGAVYWYWTAAGPVSSVDAVVEGRLGVVPVAVPGTVKDVYVKAGDSVAQGQPLLAIDPAGYEARLERERTRLAELAALLPPGLPVPSPLASRPAAPGKPLAALRAEEEEARQRVEVASRVYAEAGLAFSRMDSGAAADYAKSGPKRQAAMIARDEAAIALKQAKDAYEKASYARARREAEDKAAAAGGAVSAALAARIAEYQAQLSRVRLAERQVADTVLTAPESGRVALLAARPGVTLEQGDTPVAIVPDTGRDLWVTARFAAGDAGRLSPGQECGVALPGSGGTLPGTIASVAPSPEAEKDVAVRVNLDQDGLPAGLAPGMAVTVTVHTGRADPLASLLGNTARK